MFEIIRGHRPNMLRVLNLLGHDMDDLSTMFDNLSHFHGISPLSTVKSASFSPSLEIIDKKEKYIASIELPGLSEDDVKVSITEENVLIIQGEKRVENKDEGDEYYVSECYYGSFRREIPLPHGIVIDNIEASFEKGVLTLDIPKEVAVKKTLKEIDIKKKKMK